MQLSKQHKMLRLYKQRKHKSCFRRFWIISPRSQIYPGFYHKPRKSCGCVVEKLLQSGHRKASDLKATSLFCYLVVFTFFPQSCTLSGRTKSGLPSPPVRWTRSGTVDTTSGFWQESWCILDSSCPGDDLAVFIYGFFFDWKLEGQFNKSTSQSELCKQQSVCLLM